MLVKKNCNTNNTVPKNDITYTGLAIKVSILTAANFLLKRILNSLANTSGRMDFSLPALIPKSMLRDYVN